MTKKSIFIKAVFALLFLSCRIVFCVPDGTVEERKPLLNKEESSTVLPVCDLSAIFPDEKGGYRCVLVFNNKRKIAIFNKTTKKKYLSFDDEGRFSPIVSVWEEDGRLISLHQNNDCFKWDFDVPNRAKVQMDFLNNDSDNGHLDRCEQKMRNNIDVKLLKNTLCFVDGDQILLKWKNVQSFDYNPQLDRLLIFEGPSQKYSRGNARVLNFRNEVNLHLGKSNILKQMFLVLIKNCIKEK